MKATITFIGQCVGLFVLYLFLLAVMDVLSHFIFPFVLMPTSIVAGCALIAYAILNRK